MVATAASRRLIRAARSRPGCDELGDDLRAELHAAVPFPLWVVPDQELFPVGMELRVELDLDPADAQDPGTAVQVPWPQFNEFPPPQASLDGGLDQQLGTSVWERLIDRIELFRGSPRGLSPPSRGSAA